ncbi:unnamed protein product [Linum tenue]|uniref:Uncharacterized protein n=1 Tax=Linum tenue TaxID=586396 RepID=A0AAV0NYF5_9ROSI|nr:unnamed protein product [Linum tenue]CAI0463565.1 unnamed protein product [Linum tenue]
MRGEFPVRSAFQDDDRVQCHSCPDEAAEREREGAAQSADLAVLPGGECRESRGAGARSCADGAGRSG